MPPQTRRKTKELKMLVRLSALLVALGAWMVVGACSSGGGGRLRDAAVLDGFAVDFLFGDVPAGCPPNAANERGVGAFCTKQGNECATGLVCSCSTYLGFTPPVDTPCFCTVPILGKTCTDPSIPPGYCGQGASCCSYMTLGSICVPNVCLGGSMCPDFGAPMSPG